MVIAVLMATIVMTMTTMLMLMEKILLVMVMVLDIAKAGTAAAVNRYHQLQLAIQQFRLPEHRTRAMAFGQGC